MPVARNNPGVLAFLDELRINGFTEGQNLRVLPDGFEVGGEQIAALASTLVAARPDVILTGGDLATRAVLRDRPSPPIVAVAEDLVASGFADSLKRPGGNSTGVNLMSAELDTKRLSLLLEALPKARRVGVLADTSITPERHLLALKTVSSSRAELVVIGVSAADQIVAMIDRAKASGVEAINVLLSPLLYLNRQTIYERVASLRLPTIYQWPEMAAEGGFMAYGPRFVQLFRQRARIAVKILRGTKAADIPVEQPTSVELAINLRTARALRLTVPPTLLARAAELIE